MCELEELLAVWLPRQRWFSGKGIPLRRLRILSRHQLLSVGPEGPDLNLLVLEAGQRGTTSRYQIMLGSRPPRTLPAHLARTAIGVCQVFGGRAQVVYDAAHDEELTGLLLERFADTESAGRSEVRFRTLPGARVRTGEPGRLLTGEQSNTSLVFGRDHVLKTFRRLWPGPNPDLELNTALSGSPYVAEPCGWIEADLPGSPTPTTLAMLQTFVPEATDGWVLATVNVRSLLAGATQEREAAFAEEAALLGRTTAEVHRSLSQALPTDVLSLGEISDLAEAMVERLAMATAEVPELAEHAQSVMSAYSDFSQVDGPLPTQRVHGDYHLGQVIRPERGWVLLDFEGEPTMPVQDRRRLSNPLRDVAGMLRSFDYAAGYLLIDHPGEPDLEQSARSWARHNREAFCRGYADGGGIDPEKHLIALRAFEFDKAVYEVLYEARNRPNWLRVPLDSIASAVATSVPG
ncbi:maltokinase N-terminal cap-like domain-containing protein [Nocardiopsis xinjiangensis]|uniref:maltokinase N-terminal cap-like domain-containing protein n=1 Tax=Nocardiopsis xinjiangensis TaxID=124285 RepID=UPI00034D61C2|nr:phosphotransferase [Nocardiopsis xinjiangensis]